MNGVNATLPASALLGPRPIDPKLDYINRLPTEILIDALGLRTPRDEAELFRRQRAYHQHHRSVALLCRRFNEMLPHPTEYGINSKGQAERLLEILKSENVKAAASTESRGRRSRFKRLLVDFTKEKSYALQRSLAELLDQVQDDISEVEMVDREEPSDPPRLIQRLVDTLVAAKLTRFKLTITSRSGGVAAIDLIRRVT